MNTIGLRGDGCSSSVSAACTSATGCSGRPANRWKDCRAIGKRRRNRADASRNGQEPDPAVGQGDAG